MHPILRNVLAVLLGCVLGSFLNFGLFTLGHMLFPIEGIDPNNMEDLARVMPTLGLEYFIFPFLAHALGTLLGAFLAAKYAIGMKRGLALLVGFFFLAGGIMAANMIPAPTWFIVVDLVLAYIPMAYIGFKLGTR